MRAVPIDLAELVAPGHTAIVTQECQRGILGPESALPVLAESARTSGMIDNVARIVQAGRHAGVEVLHAIAVQRADLKGANRNAPLFRGVAKSPVRQLVGSPNAQLVDGIEPDEGDLYSYRYHGVGPFAGTDVDSLLRNLGRTTVVIVGVSSNVAIPNGVFDAVNLGYQVVLLRDAIAGVPPEYTDTIIANSLSLVSTVVTTDELLDCWKA